MSLTAEFLKSAFQEALNFEDYLATGDAEQRKRWQEIYMAATLNDKQKELLDGFVRQMNVLVVSGIWCGDCVEQCPLLMRIAEGSDNIHLRFLDRDANAELRDQVAINTGARVPVALFLAEDYALCSWYGDRSLNRYRHLAQKQMGAACSTGLFVPDAEELALTLADWLNEFERIQLMLRLSTRLRNKHQD